MSPILNTQNALSICFLSLTGELTTDLSSLHAPLCLAGKRHRIQSCEKPPAWANWRLYSSPDKSCRGNRC